MPGQAQSPEGDTGKGNIGYNTLRMTQRKRNPGRQDESKPPGDVDQYIVSLGLRDHKRKDKKQQQYAQNDQMLHGYPSVELSK